MVKKWLYALYDMLFDAAYEEPMQIDPVDYEVVSEGGSLGYLPLKVTLDELEAYQETGVCTGYVGNMKGVSGSNELFVTVMVPVEAISSTYWSDSSGYAQVWVTNEGLKARIVLK